MSQNTSDPDISLEGGFHIQTGSVLQDRYKIEGLLGQGGFATVFEGFDTRLERQVAIKILNIDPLLLSEESREALLSRFLREARAAARIEHPNAVTIHDTGVLDQLQRPFIVMERLLGHDLDVELDRKGPMKPVRAIGLFVRALEAIAEAHELGVVHKDLKPANLFLTRPRTDAEDMKVLDFGVARLQEQSASLTSTGQIAGTPQYLSPEYIDHQVATPAMDVYQMGLVLVEMLTGQPVVNSNHTLECLLLHTSGDLPIPGWIQQGALGPVVRKALRSNHKSRYQSAREFLAALRKIDPALIDDPRKRAADDIIGDTGDLFFAESLAEAFDPNLIEPPKIELDSLDEPPLALEPDPSPMELLPLIPEPFRPLPGPSKTALITPEVTPKPKVPETLDEVDPSTIAKTQLMDAPRKPAPAKPQAVSKPRPSEPTPRKAKPWIWVIAAGILALVVAISLAVYAISSIEFTSTPTKPIEPPLIGAPGTSAPVEITLKSSPNGASIVHDNETLGQTPITLRLQGDSPMLFRFEKPGFASRNVLIDPNNPPTDPFRLEDID